MNLRPSGYEPDELPDCSIPRRLSPYFFSGFGAEDRNRTGTVFNHRRILSPVRLPVPPPRLMALRVGLEPTTYRLTAGCSTIELPKIMGQTGLRLLSPFSHSCFFKLFVRQYPTFPGRCQPSNIGAWRLNFRVRDGNGWYPLAMVTGYYMTPIFLLVKSSAD